MTDNEKIVNNERALMRMTKRKAECIEPEICIIVLNRLVQFNVIRRYVKTNSIHTTHRLNALAAPPGIRV